MDSQRVLTYRPLQDRIKGSAGLAATLLVASVTAVSLSATLYFAYGISQLLSIWVEGLPDDILVPATILGGTLLLLSLLLLVQRRLVK